MSNVDTLVKYYLYTFEHYPESSQDNHKLYELYQAVYDTYQSADDSVLNGMPDFQNRLDILYALNDLVMMEFSDAHIRPELRLIAQNIISGSFHDIYSTEGSTVRIQTAVSEEIKKIKSENPVIEACLSLNNRDEARDSEDYYVAEFEVYEHVIQDLCFDNYLLMEPIYGSYTQWRKLKYNGAQLLGYLKKTIAGLIKGGKNYLDSKTLNELTEIINGNDDAIVLMDDLYINKKTIEGKSSIFITNLSSDIHKEILEDHAKLKDISYIQKETSKDTVVSLAKHLKHSDDI